jgi:hypothetical protein
VARAERDVDAGDQLADRHRVTAVAVTVHTQAAVGVTTGVACRSPSTMTVAVGLTALVTVAETTAVAVLLAVAIGVTVRGAAWLVRVAVGSPTASSVCAWASG